MEPKRNLRQAFRFQPTNSIWVLLMLGLLSSLKVVQCKGLRSPKPTTVGCRAHNVSLKDFGGIGDGITLNTEAFRSAVAYLNQFSSDGGGLLYVPAGRWVTGSFNLTSRFTLYLHKDAVILGSPDMNDWPIIDPLPSYGRGRDAPGGRYSPLIFGSNLTDVVITGDNGTIDGQGGPWWKKYRAGELNHTRGHLIELMFSNRILISKVTLMNSPFWTVHPVYSSNVIVSGITILAPVNSANTDGIDPDSCSNVLIEDCYIVSGDDCIAIKSGWDEYGIAFHTPSRHILIRRLTCISPTSAAIALGSEMSGGIQDVRAEDIHAIDTESAVRIKSSVGRGGYVRDVYVRRMKLKTMKYVFWMTGDYGNHPDNHYDPNAVPVIEGISYSDVTAKNVTIAGQMQGTRKVVFKGLCLSNVKIRMAKGVKGRPAWNCTGIEGTVSSVSPSPCAMLRDVGGGRACPFPKKRFPIERVGCCED